MVEVSLLAAFLTGLLGGVHCVGMCGGLVATLGLSLPSGSPPSRLFGYLLAYNSGRLLSYGVAGGLLGSLGGWLLTSGQLPAVRSGAQAVAALFMVVLGLYLGGWWPSVVLRLERLGSGFWRRLQPLAQRLLPVRSMGHALLLGVVWGWLPCGLVYTLLIGAASSGSGWSGAALLLSFGLGTLPNLLALGWMAESLRRQLQQRWLRQSAGGLVIGLGLWQGWQLLT